MKDRIKKIREDAGLNQSKFGERISISRSAVWKIENGENTPSEQTISLICKEFNINENWLRFGTEPMKVSHIEFGDICREIGVNDPKARQAILDYYELSPSDKELFWKFVEKFMK